MIIQRIGSVIFGLMALGLVLALPAAAERSVENAGEVTYQQAMHQLGGLLFSLIAPFIPGYLCYALWRGEGNPPPQSPTQPSDRRG
jgi:fructose-specific phosphotransferase system IIC component